MKGALRKRILRASRPKGSLLGSAAATALATAALVAAAGGSTASGDAGHLPQLFDFWIAPHRLPARKPAPVTMSLSWKGGTDDGSHSPALRKLTIEGDRQIVFDATGLPVCEGGPHFDVRPSDLPKRCRKAAVGHGQIVVEVEFPEEPPLSVEGELTLYNLGRKPGGLDLLARTFLPAPITGEIVFTIKVREIDKGRYGWRAIALLPKIAGGHGSITDYSPRIGKRLLSATCADGRLTLRALSEFADGTRRREMVARACRAIV